MQEEFRRLYFQLEELKERNMRLGNRHLVAKITAMQEAADNIFCTSAQINGQQTGSEGASPNTKGKSGVLSDISEEENPSLPQSAVETPKPDATGIASDKASFFAGNSESDGDHRSKLEKAGQEEDVGDGNHDVEKVEVAGSKIKKREKVQFEHLELQDTNLDEVDSEEEKGVTSSVFEGERSDIKLDCISDVDATENIPMQSLRKRRHTHQKSTTSPNPSSESRNSGGLNSTEIGKQKKSGDKSQNHSGTSAPKLVLDLDDKSRFTEEITV